MIYNTGWTNLIPQKLKYSPALGKAAASKLEAGQTLTSVASELRVSRASLRNWQSRDPRLNVAGCALADVRLGSSVEGNGA